MTKIIEIKEMKFDNDGEVFESQTEVIKLNSFGHIKIIHKLTKDEICFHSSQSLTMLDKIVMKSKEIRLNKTIEDMEK